MTSVTLAPALRPELLRSRLENLNMRLALHIFTFCSPSDAVQAGKVDRYFYRVYKQWLHNMRPDERGSICQEYLDFYMRAVGQRSKRPPVLDRLTECCSLTPLSRNNLLSRVTSLALNCTEKFHNRLQEKLFPADYQKTIYGFKDLEITALFLHLHSSEMLFAQQRFFAGDLTVNCPKLTTLSIETASVTQLELVLSSLPNFKSLQVVVLKAERTWKRSLFAPLARCPDLRQLKLEGIQLDAVAIRELFALIQKSVKHVDIQHCKGPVDKAAIQEGRLTRTASFVIRIPAAK